MKSSKINFQKSLSYYDTNGTVLFMQNIINSTPGVHVIHISAFYDNIEHSVTRTYYNSQTFPFMPGNQF